MTVEQTTETEKPQRSHVRYAFVLESATPMAHAWGTEGNASIAMRAKVRQRDGTFAMVPIVTGDTMRHGLRESIAWAMLDAAGLTSEALTEAAMRLLFAGGMVTGSAGDALKLDQYRQLTEIVPALALLGGCAQNRVIPGRLTCDEALLVCEESLPTIERVSPAVHELLVATGARFESCRAHIEEVQRVRMDPMLDPGKRKLLAPDARDHVERRLAASERATADGDAVAKQETKSAMLPRTHERVVAGSWWFWTVEAVVWTELERSTFLTMVASFLADARVGGKRATGHGLLRPMPGLCREIQIARPSERAVEATALAGHAGAAFVAHCRAKSAEIRDFLATVTA